jgi:hypothetical protein
VTLLLDRAVSGRRYTPLSLFATAWLGPLALYHLRLVDYAPMQPKGALLLYGSYCTFVLGYLLVVLPYRRAFHAAGEARLLADLRAAPLTAIAVVLSLAGAVATLVQTRAVLREFGPLGFVLAPLAVREEFVRVGWGTLFECNLLVPAILVLRHQVLGRRDRLTVILGVVAGVGLVLADQKQTVVKAGVIAGGAATLLEGRVRLRHLAVGALLLLGFFVGYARLTSPYYSGDHRFYVRDGHIHLPRALAPLGNPYHYVTSPFANFQVLVEDHDVRRHGLQTLRPLRYLWLRLQGTRDIETHHGRFYYAPLYGNTHTWLRQPYEDFGMAGVLGFPALVGLLCGWIFAEAALRGRVAVIPAYGVLGWCLFISFFSNHWVYFGTWVLAAIALLVGAAMAWGPAMDRLRDATRPLVAPRVH